MSVLPLSKTHFATFDQALDYIPFVSTVTSIVALAVKAFAYFVPSASCLSNRYIQYLNDKSTYRCQMLLIPFIGNFLIALFDLSTSCKSSALFLVQNGLSLASVDENLRDDLDIVQTAIKEHGFLESQYASERLQHDPALIHFAIEHRLLLLNRHSPDWIRSNKQIALAFMQRGGHNLRYVTDALKGDRDVVHLAVVQNGKALEHASDRLKRDPLLIAVAKRDINLRREEWARNVKEIVLAFVQEDGLQLEHAGEDRFDPWVREGDDRVLKNNREVVLAAVQQNGLALQYASEHLRGDAEIVRAAIQQNTRALGMATFELQDNRELIDLAIAHGLRFEDWVRFQPTIAAVFMEIDGQNLALASDAIKDIPGVVLAAVGQNGLALQHASENLRNTAGIVAVAVRQNGLALQHASDAMKGCYKIVREAVLQNWQALQYASLELQEDPRLTEIAIREMEKTGLNYLYTDWIGRNKPIVLHFVSQEGQGGWLQCVNQDLRKDPDVVRAAVSDWGRNLQFASPELQKDPEMIQLAIEKRLHLNGETKEWILGNRPLTLACLKNGDSFSYTFDDVCDDLEIAKIAVAQRPSRLLCVSDALKDNEELIRVAYEKDPREICHASERLREKFAKALKDKEEVDEDANFMRELFQTEA